MQGATHFIMYYCLYSNESYQSEIYPIESLQDILYKPSVYAIIYIKAKTTPQ